MNPQNVKLNYSDAKSDKNHKDGGLTINSALLLRDNTLPEDSTTYWQFGPNTRTIGDITDSFFFKRYPIYFTLCYLCTSRRYKTTNYTSPSFYSC